MNNNVYILICRDNAGSVLESRVATDEKEATQKYEKIFSEYSDHFIGVYRMEANAFLARLEDGMNIIQMSIDHSTPVSPLSLIC